MTSNYTRITPCPLHESGNKVGFNKRVELIFNSRILNVHRFVVKRCWSVNTGDASGLKGGGDVNGQNVRLKNKEMH